MTMDATDIRILRLLQSNGRLSIEQVAQTVHLSRPAVHERVRRLEQTGAIRGYQAQIDWAAVGLPITAFVSVRTSISAAGVAIAIVALNAEYEDALVEDCHQIIGEWCLLVKIRAGSSRALQIILDRVRSLSGVQETMTTISLFATSEACLPGGEGAVPGEKS
ncbi:AsnC family transcriptional regulator [Capsulimonas corticalis]|uniref:AsnC family transcriptional regulator n=2 Tax=Capsulimonas corticalis TaxID=2219043 RepID=A0A9N7L1S1_9BACT|nr:AsnC family transcriptional regulator [Capsulimonas corticalis]